MAEPDHIIVKPIPNLSKDGLGAAFPFFYIEPKKYETQLRKYFPENKGPITNIDPIGNSPVIVGKVCNVLYLTESVRILCLHSNCLPRLNKLLVGISEEDCSHLDECFFGNEEGS